MAPTFFGGGIIQRERGKEIPPGRGKYIYIGSTKNLKQEKDVVKVIVTIELVKNMPRWNPGVQNGKTVPVYFILPVVFRLD